MASVTRCHFDSPPASSVIDPERSSMMNMSRGMLLAFVSMPAQPPPTLEPEPFDPLEVVAKPPPVSPPVTVESLSDELLPPVPVNSAFCEAAEQATISEPTPNATQPTKPHRRAAFLDI